MRNYEDLVDSFEGHWEKNADYTLSSFTERDLSLIRSSIDERRNNSSDYEISNPKLNNNGGSLSFELHVDNKKVNTPEIIFSGKYSKEE